MNYSSSARAAWLIVALLFPVALLNYLDRQMLATMKSSMVGDIPSIANKADWGLVLGCFKWTYAFLSPFAGFIYFTLPAIAGWVVKDWMPDILKERFSIGQGQAGVTAVLYVQIASLAGVLLGGYLADRWMRRTPRGRIFVSAIGMMLFLPALFSVGNASFLGMAIAGLIVFGLGWGFFDCNNMPILSQIARPHLLATGYGIMNMVSTSFGGVGDWGFGFLRDRHVPLNVIFGAFAGIALFSVFLVLLIRPRPPEPNTP